MLNDERNVQICSATMPASGPYVCPKDDENRNASARPMVASAQSATATPPPNASHAYPG